MMRASRSGPGAIGPSCCLLRRGISCVPSSSSGSGSLAAEPGSIVRRLFIPLTAANVGLAIVTFTHFLLGRWWVVVGLAITIRVGSVAFLQSLSTRLYRPGLATFRHAGANALTSPQRLAYPHRPCHVTCQVQATGAGRCLAY